jgi:hypothetical protein
MSAGLPLQQSRYRGWIARCGDDGVPNFDRIRYRRHDSSVFRAHDPV